jgi:outer membrane protein assembly factor BamE (lipoprotein component of BamABCDE complex)
MQKINYLSKIITLALVGALTACVSVGNEQVNQVSAETLQNKFIRGKSTKADVRLQLGSPNKIEFIASGNEQWSYEYLAVNAFKQYGAMLTGGRVFDQGKRVIVLFDTRGILLNYSAE